ncbi:MAG: VWA domain-containing protein [Pseudomonadota bacterium]
MNQFAELPKPGQRWTEWRGQGGKLGASECPHPMASPSERFTQGSVRVELGAIAKEAASVEQPAELLASLLALLARGLQQGAPPRTIKSDPAMLHIGQCRQRRRFKLTAEERAAVQDSGGFEALMEKLKERLAEQTKRHQGGSKWIGTAGTSPFGAYGYNPEGVRIGQDESRHQRAVKVWDKRQFRNLDDTVELGTRNIKVALKRLRRWAREGAAEELDLGETIRATAEHGYLDVQTRPERHNAVKVLLFLDVGGSMDPYIRLVEELFSAARAEFKHLEYYYFHNCIYEGVWRDNQRRWDAQTPTAEVLRTYGADYRCLVVGDASMSPYEVLYPGGANEFYNAEAGEVWLRRLREAWPASVWINPLPQDTWRYTQSIALIQEIFAEAMFPMTLEGINDAVRALGR